MHVGIGRNGNGSANINPNGRKLNIRKQISAFNDNKFVTN
jgi:hypothetical protein